MPRDSLAWMQWDAADWNRQLLLFCFVQEADAPSLQGIRASEDDLQVLTGDLDTSPAMLAMALKRALALQASAHQEALTPAALMARQVRSFLPTPDKLPPFFAFLWFTCLVAHGFPDPQMEGRFHSRFEQLFGNNQERHLTALPEAWQKLIRWLALDGIFAGAPHRSLQLRPIPGNARLIGHSWTLSFPRLADRRLLLEHLNHDQLRGHQLDPWSPSFISRLQQVSGFSHDFRDELRRHAEGLRTDPDLDSWFTGFLLAEIEQLFRHQDTPEEEAAGSRFGPLLLRSYGRAMGVLLLSQGLPANEIGLFERVEGHPWGVDQADLLVPTDSADPLYAAYDAGSMAIDGLASPITALRALLQRGLLLFRRDPELDQLRLVLGAPSGAISHALVSEAHAETFQNHLGGEPVPCDEEGWQCWRGFTATAEQLRRFPSTLSRGSRTDRPQLIPVGGKRLERGFLATGVGLPEVNVRGPHTPRALLLLSPENRSIDYQPALPAADPHHQAEPDPSRWTPKARGRAIPSFLPGEARLVAFFEEMASLECRIQLDRVPPRPLFQRGDPLHRREDWGQTLGPTWLEDPVPEQDLQEPSTSGISQARGLLNEGQGNSNPKTEEQMLEALCAIFQRRSQIRDHEFLELFRRLGSMSTRRRYFERDVLRAWVEGGWLDQGLVLRRGLWRLQPVQPRLVILSEGELQLVGLLPAIGLVQVLAHAFDLGLQVDPVPPACPLLPRGWRFRGEAWAALAVITGLPLVDRDAWVPDPRPISWQVEPSECDHTDWSGSSDHPIRDIRIVGMRQGDHRHTGEALPQDMIAKESLTILQEQGLNGRYRWHHTDKHHERFSSCHRNRVVLYALNDATNGLWPFGANCAKATIVRIYDADAYLPLPIGRWSALMGAAMPGPDLPTDIQKHTYRYHVNEGTLLSFLNDRRLPLTKPPSRKITS
ncbi:MAG: hypothetical protein VKI63_04730 [Cyanobium sp.]|nr:hypothetical protein [Cyanobium sp.]